MGQTPPARQLRPLIAPRQERHDGEVAVGESYRYWQEYFGRDDFEFGQFGANFTVEGLSDDEVCIGDRYRIGEDEFESPAA